MKFDPENFDPAKMPSAFGPRLNSDKAELIIEFFEKIHPEVYLNEDKRFFPFDATNNRMVHDSVMNKYWIDFQAWVKGNCTTELWNKVTDSTDMPVRSPLKEMFMGGRYKSEEGALKAIKKFTDNFVLSNNDERLFFDEVMTKWFVGAVAGVMEDYKFNNIFPVIVGDNATGKSYILKRLLPAKFKGFNFCEATIPENTKMVSKDFEMRVTETFIVYFDEMVNVYKAQGNWMRQILDRTDYMERSVYRRREELIQRRSSFIGSTNDATTIINDPEHNRRIVPFEIVDNEERLKGGPFDDLNKRAMWQAAKYLYDKGFDHELDIGQIKVVKDRSADFAIEDMYLFFSYEIIEEGKEFMTSHDVCKKAKEMYGSSDWKPIVMGKYLTRLAKEGVIKKTKLSGASGYRLKFRLEPKNKSIEEDKVPF